MGDGFLREEEAGEESAVLRAQLLIRHKLLRSLFSGFQINHIRRFNGVHGPVTHTHTHTHTH